MFPALTPALTPAVSPGPAGHRHRRSPARSLLTGLLTAALALGGATLVLGCSGDASMSQVTAKPTMTATTSAEASAGSMEHGRGMTPVELDTAWSARPAYVRDNGAAVSEAYAFALSRPEPLESMPCYCGCVAMDHRSNLDCFFKPRTSPTDPLRFEEHASFCGICIDTALLTKHRLAEGRTLREIRDEVDQTIGSNGVEGTHTALPPVA